MISPPPPDSPVWAEIAELAADSGRCAFAVANDLEPHVLHVTLDPPARPRMVLVAVPDVMVIEFYANAKPVPHHLEHHLPGGRTVALYAVRQDGSETVAEARRK